MATAFNGRVRWIPLVQRSFLRNTFNLRGIRRRPDEEGDPCKQQTMSDRLVAADRCTAAFNVRSAFCVFGRAKRPRLSPAPLTGLNRWPGFESLQVEARVPPPEFEHAVILACLPAKSAPFADQ
jgi:hypothetical protein